ncbi:hypothetical protein, partial [Dermacoccus nishinomiyaensis]|uniref:hypothetical protein n=1 Tax=Dermacoccus nishinomiyaensis TaxID=1274 RepID=UPI00164319A3
EVDGGGGVVEVIGGGEDVRGEVGVVGDGEVRGGGEVEGEGVVVGEGVEGWWGEGVGDEEVWEVMRWERGLGM